MSDDEKKEWLKGLGVSTFASTDTSSAGAAAGVALPTIWVTPKSDGSFDIKGTAFQPGAGLRIRVVDEHDSQLDEVDYQSKADGKGGFDFQTPVLCPAPGKLHFSVTDGRPNEQDLTGFLWSNTVTETCADAGDGGDGADGGDGGDGGDGSSPPPGDGGSPPAPGDGGGSPAPGDGGDGSDGSS